MSKAVLRPAGSAKASVGTPERARALAVADEQLFLALDQSIRAAL
jgi:hypothetical protein